VLQQLASRLDALQAQATAKLEGQGFGPSQIKVERFLNLRFAGRRRAGGGAAAGLGCRAGRPPKVHVRILGGLRTFAPSRQTAYLI
jgi:hypothetical protein